MEWVWQWDDWPKYQIWDYGRRADYESRFLKDASLASERLERMDTGSRGSIEAELLATEAVMTSKIDNVDLDRDAVLASLRHLMRLDVDSRITPSYETSVARFLLDVHRNFAEPLTAERMFSWHEQLMEAHPQVRDVGKYRTGKKPMVVVSGGPGRYRVHYEAPPSSRVPDDMKRFLEGYNKIGQQQGDDLWNVTDAAFAHLQFVQMLPFAKGNGFIARAIADMAISRSLGRSSPVKMSHDIFENRGEYFETLGRAGTDIMVTDWVLHFTRTGTKSAERTLRRIEEVCG